MPQRLPLVFALGALGLLALPCYAEVTPMHRPPAVPPLAAEPQQIAPLQAQPADPVAQKRDAETQGLSDIVLSTLSRGIDFGHPVPTQITLTAAEPDNQAPAQATDTAALKRDAQTQGLPDIAVSALITRPINFAQPAPTQITLVQAAPEKAKPADQTLAQAQPAQDAPGTPAQPHGDIANFLPDIDLKGISQDPALGYHASIAPFTAEKAVAEATPPSAETKALALPDIAPSLKVTVAFNYSEPLSLLIMPADEEKTVATSAPKELPPVTPRQRPHDLVASNDDHAGEPRPLSAKGEPLFELRR